MTASASNLLRFLPYMVCALGIMTFGAMDAVMKMLSLALGTYNALFWRCLATAAMAAILFMFSGSVWPERTVLRLHFVRASVTAVMAFTFFWGLARTPIAEAIGISFVAPLIALYLAAVMLGERISRYAIFASVLGLIGVGVIIAGKLGSDFTSDAKWGMASILLSACLYAWNLILQRQQSQIAKPQEIAFFQNSIVSLWLVLFFPWFGLWPASEVSTGIDFDWYWSALIGIGAVLALISGLALSWAYARAETQALVPIEYSMFIWAALFGWLLFDEPVGLATLFGTVLIVGGCLLAARASANQSEGHPHLNDEHAAGDPLKAGVHP